VPVETETAPADGGTEAVPIDEGPVVKQPDGLEPSVPADGDAPVEAPDSSKPPETDE